MANSTQEAIRIAAEGIKDLKTEMTSLNTIISKGAKDLHSMLSADATSFKELSKLIKQVEKNTKKLNDASEKKLVVGKKIKTQQNQLAKTFQSLAKQREKEGKQVTKLNKARLKEADAIERNKNALKKQKDAVIELSRPFNELIAKQKLAKRVLQDLTVSQGKNSKATRQAQKNYDRLTAKVNQANRATSNFSKKGLLSATRGLTNLLGAFGFIGGIQLFASAIRDTFNRVIQFDKSMQNLAGVFRTTREELKPLEETIIEVAGSSIKTSREIAKLAETLATLGKTPEKIQTLLKPVVDLGIALNATGAEAGEFLIQMLNAFGASDDEAMSYADTIATIRTSTTLDFQKMRDSFQYIAPISKLLNKDLAYTGAVVGILADNGLKAQQSGRVLGTSLQKLAKEGLTLTDALNKINKAESEGVDGVELLAMANTLLGAEGAKVGVVLAKNSGLIEKNAQSVRDNGGAINDLVEEQLKSLDARLKILNSSWEEFILNIDNGTGAIGTGLGNAIDYLSENLEKLIGFVVTSAKSWILYKTMVLAAALQTKAMSLAALLSAKRMSLLGKSTFSTTKRIVQFNNALKANTIGLIIAALYLAYEAFQYFNTPLKESTALLVNQTEELDKQVSSYIRNKESVDKMADSYEKLVDKGMKRTNIETHEMNRLFIELSKSAPIVITKVDKFGVATEIATEKLKKFNEEQEKVIIFDANENIKNNKELIKEAENDIDTARGVIFRSQEKGDKETEVFWIKRKQRAEKSKQILENQILDNKDLIGSITGVLTERQKEVKTEKEAAESLEVMKVGRRAFINDNKKQILLLPKLVKELAQYEKQLLKLKEGGGIAVGEKKQFYELRKIISDTKKEIEDLTGSGSGTIESPKVEGLNLDEIGIDNGKEKLNKYQKDLISFLETLKETEDVPELMPLSQEAQEKLEKYNKELSETALKLSELENLKDIFAEVTDTFADMFDIDVSKFDFLFDDITNTVEDWASLSKELIGSVLDASLQGYDIELQQAKITRDLILNNDLESDEKKQAAKAKFDEKERKINTEKAKQERQNNLIKIAVDTAVGVVSAFGNPFKIAAIIALGLSQAAVVASQPLPQFEKGTQNSPEGMAITDEKGAEIHTDKKGNIKDLGSNQGARKKFLDKGDKIFTADQSKGMLNNFSSENLQKAVFDMNMFGNGNVVSEKVADKALLNKMDSLASSNEMVWREVKKLASRPVNVNNKVEIKQDRAY